MLVRDEFSSSFFSLSFDEKNRSLPFHPEIFLQLRVEKERFLIKVLVKQICIYIYIFLGWFYLSFFFFLIFFIPFYAVSSRCCSIPYLWNRARMGWIPVDSFSEWIILGSWNDLCFREIYSSIILLVYRESNRDENPFLICHQFAYILLYLIFCYCGDLHLWYTIYIYCKVVLFCRIMYTRKRKRETKGRII